MIFALSTLLVVKAQAKVLEVNCQDQNQDQIIQVLTNIENINLPQEIQEFTINGHSTSQMEDRTESPLMRNGVFHLKYAFGSGLYNSLSLELNHCNDSFMASGSGTLKLYVGGMRGTQQVPLTCQCRLD